MKRKTNKAKEEAWSQTAHAPDGEQPRPEASGTSGQSVPKSKFRKKSQQEQAAAAKLRMESQGEKLEQAREKLAKQKPPKKPGPVKRIGRVASGSVHSFVHGKIFEVEQENVGTEGAHRSELVGETALRHGSRFVRRKVREHPAKVVRKAEARYTKYTADYHFHTTAQEHPELTKNALTRYWQKQRLRRQYRKQAKEAAKQSAAAAGKTATATERLTARAVEFVKSHPAGAVIAVLCVLLLFAMQSCSSTMLMLGNAGAGALGASTYPCEERDMLAAEAAYCVSYLQIMASELSDKLLAEILELDAEMTVTMHIQTVDQLKAIKTIKGKISDIGKMKVEEQRKAVRSGYDPDILPPDLITFSKDAAELLADLQSRNERMFLLTFTVVNLAPNRQRLENDVFTVGGIAQKYNCALRRLDWQQEQGFVSSLALGYNEVEIQRGMTTSSTAIFIPFMTRELRMAGQALYYGMNALSHNVIMADRKKLKSANGMYLGSTGSGKSFAAKRELLNVFLTIPQDRIIVVDPMGEYAPLVRRLGGQVIEIAPDSPHHLNPMDVELNMAAGESPLSMKADFLLSLCELVVGGKEGLQPIEKTVIDRCVRLVYREQALGLETAKTPLLQDLYEELLRQPEPEARRVATALELYCTGSLNLFNHPTNVKTDSRVVCIVLKNMGENLRKIAMHITNEFVSQAVDQNFHEGAATWCYFDEFHILLRDPLTASYFVAVWKMLRKKGCVPSALTQNVKDLLASREIENILDNTDFMILLSQAQSDRTILAKQLGISEHQLSYITHSNSGEGLLFYGNVTIPFVDRFPRGEIYDLLTTRPEDMKNETKNE